MIVGISQMSIIRLIGKLMKAVDLAQGVNKGLGASNVTKQLRANARRLYFLDDFRQISTSLALARNVEVNIWVAVRILPLYLLL